MFALRMSPATPTTSNVDHSRFVQLVSTLIFFPRGSSCGQACRAIAALTIADARPDCASSSVKAGDDQEERGNSNLSGNQQTAQARAIQSLTEGRACVFERGREIGPRAFQSRRQPEQHSGRNRQQQRITEN